MARSTARLGRRCGTARCDVDDGLDGGDAAIEEDGGRGSFRRRPYVAIGAGVTRLEPESPTPALTVSEDTSAGVELGLGYDLTRWLSAELHVADLGAADIDFLGSTVGDIDYLVYGVTGLVYLFGTRDGFIPLARGRDGAFRREGLSLFGRLGVGGMSNESDLPYRRDYDTHAVFGAGLEYGFRNGVAVRAELQGFDTDARYAGVSVLKRFGRSEAAPAAAVSPPPTPPAPAPVPVVPAPADDPAPDDGMLRETVRPIVYFSFDQDTLSPESIARLDAFLEELGDSELDIVIGGHTDGAGAERYNEGLSDRRADAVRDYLVSRGIDLSRMTARGHGEDRPASSNATEEGRAQNRRAEIRLR